MAGFSCIPRTGIRTASAQSDCLEGGTIRNDFPRRVALNVKVWVRDQGPIPGGGEQLKRWVDAA